jgi:hypothetical protein
MYAITVRLLLDQAATKPRSQTSLSENKSVAASSTRMIPALLPL